METWRNEHGKDLGDGPWNDEPDKAVWIDEVTDLDCMIHRGRMGALCGYVGVGPDHPLHRTDYDQINPDVHGGLTYASGCQEGDDPAFGICHIPQSGRSDNIWWFGFDCGHFQDFIPGLSKTLKEIDAPDVFSHTVYRDFDYIKTEVESLAKQLLEDL